MSESPGCPYKLLGVTISADDGEIQKAFDHHKDAFYDKKQAFELLIDPNRRRAFDRERENEKEKVNKGLISERISLN